MSREAVMHCERESWMRFHPHHRVDRGCWTRRTGGKTAGELVPADCAPLLFPGACRRRSHPAASSSSDRSPRFRVFGRERRIDRALHPLFRALPNHCESRPRTLRSTHFCRNRGGDGHRRRHHNCIEDVRFAREGEQLADPKQDATECRAERNTGAMTNTENNVATYRA